MAVASPRMTGARIAMWSGPRNISTAMMRAWGNREDCFVCDEPLYAHYLMHTGFDHPGSDEILAHHETDWRKVVDWLTGPIPEGRSVFYQKQMAHHLLPHIERAWLDALTHVFLIREPREMITSYLVRRPTIRLEDTGLPQQLEIFERVRAETGEIPPVIDAKDVLTDPRAVLSALCRRLDLPFTERMLSWPEGPRETDGIWAVHWYDAVEKSNGFGPYRPKGVAVPAQLEPLAAECEAIYDRLQEYRLTA